MEIKIDADKLPMCNIDGCGGRLLPVIECETLYGRYGNEKVVPNSQHLKWECANKSKHKEIETQNTKIDKYEEKIKFLESQVEEYKKENKILNERKDDHKKDFEVNQQLRLELKKAKDEIEELKKTVPAAAFPNLIEIQCIKHLSGKSN